MRHYTKEELELYRNGKMSVLGKIACSTHLKGCKECASLLDELKEDDRFVAELCSSLQAYQAVAEKTMTSDK